VDRDGSPALLQLGPQFSQSVFQALAGLTIHFILLEYLLYYFLGLHS
jgi:hypothetical protein